MHAEHHGFIKYGDQEQLMPQEEVLDINYKSSKLTIGVPAEVSFQECRVPLVPQAVGLLVGNGHKVLVETKAGHSAHFKDNDYSNVGAQIVYSKDEIYQADIVIKVAPPTLEEVDLMKDRQALLSSVHLTGQSREYFEKLSLKRITALAFEFIRDKTDSFPVIRAMSEIAGTTAIHVANQYLTDSEYGKGVILGGFPGVTPTEVVILGAGTVAEYAARTCLGSGAVVKVFDNSIYRLRRLQNTLNNRIFTSVIQPLVLSKALKSADVVIGAIHSPDGVAPCVVTDGMVHDMKYGSVIIDVSIDQGGCFETSRITSHDEPVFKKHDVTHYCVPNIASRVPYTASYALSNFFTPILLRIGEVGGIKNILKIDYGLRTGAYLFNGTLTKAQIGEHFTLPYQDIELLIAAFS